MLEMKDQLYAFYVIAFCLIWLVAGIFAIRKAIQLLRSPNGSSPFQKIIHYLLAIIPAWFLINLTGIITLLCAARFSAHGWVAALQLLAGVCWADVYFNNPVFMLVFAPFWLLGLLFWLQKSTLARGLFLIAIGSISAPGWVSELILLPVAALSFLAWFIAIFGMHAPNRGATHVAGAPSEPTS